MDSDTMINVDGQGYIFYSFGEDFDHSVRYEFIQKKHKLGEGGFGSVYLAYDDFIKKEVAIKVLNFVQGSGSNYKLIEKEITALGQLRHKNIVKLYDSFPLPKKQQLIVVMEYLKGGELYELWNKQPDFIF
jgi:serine/threonine-protein kinase